MSDTSELCPACSGSGEGHYDGSTCLSCGGSGEVEVGRDEFEKVDREWADRQRERDKDDRHDRF